MELKLTLALPRDAYSVPVARRVLKSSLDALGVRADVVEAIELALTEASANVLKHAGDSHEYEVSAGIDGAMCVIEVVDHGSGFDASLRGLADAEPHAESGRGIQLMRALVDDVAFISRPAVGTVVHLEKVLEWDEGAPGRRLTEGQPVTEQGPWSQDEQLAQMPRPSPDGQHPRR